MWRLLFVQSSVGILLYLTWFWQMKNAKDLVFLGHQFSNKWTFWLAYNAAFTPLSFVINYVIFYAWWYGYSVVFPGNAWKLQSFNWFVSILVMLLIAWLYLGELPTKNTVMAIVFLTAAFLAILWK